MSRIVRVGAGWVVGLYHKNGKSTLSAQVLSSLEDGVRVAFRHLYTKLTTVELKNTLNAY